MELTVGPMPDGQSSRSDRREGLGGRVPGGLAQHLAGRPGTVARTPNSETLSAIRSAWRRPGVEFIDANGGGVGVRLRKS